VKSLGLPHNAFEKTARSRSTAYACHPAKIC